VYLGNSSIWKAEGEGSRVQRHSGVHSETVLKKKRKEGKKENTRMENIYPCLLYHINCHMKIGVAIEPHPKG
jgi:hypothetical protein